MAYITRLNLEYSEYNYSEQIYEPPWNTPRLVSKFVRVSLEACNIIVTHVIRIMSHPRRSASVSPLLKPVCTIASYGCTLLVAAEP